ncbi:MAG: hypothetical protein HXS51_09850 [Theionarchaea archaeon]|nr:hypothetical protein [Theionarchaea archaeon]MBU7039267.1 hypothetical protein [Theionarchaea archaeon]
MMFKKRFSIALLVAILILSLIPVYGDPAEPRNDIGTADTRVFDLINSLNWGYGKNGEHRKSLLMAGHLLWMAYQDENWDSKDPQTPKGPLEKAFILGAIDDALEALKQFSKDSQGKPRRLDADDGVNATMHQWVAEITEKLENAKKELEKNFYGTPQHLKDALKGLVDIWSGKSQASSTAKRAGEDAQENLCQWDANPQPSPGATPTPPWTPPKKDGKPVPTRVGGEEVRVPKRRLRLDLQKILIDIFKKNERNIRNLPQWLERNPNNMKDHAHTAADEALKLLKILRAIARLLDVPLKPIQLYRNVYVYTDPPGGWGRFPGGLPVPTGSAGTDIETVVVDSKGPDLLVYLAMNGAIEEKDGKEISLLIDRDSDPSTGSSEVVYGGLGVDASVGLYCSASSPAQWNLQVWEVSNGEWVMKEELDSSLWDISGDTVEFTIPDFKEVLGIETHVFSWIAMAYEDGNVDMGPDEPVISFSQVPPEAFSVLAQGADYDLNQDFATSFSEYTTDTDAIYAVQLGGPAIHEGLWMKYGVFFMKDEGEHYSRLVSEEEEYQCVWGELDYCVLVFEVTQEGITVNIAGITRYGTRSGLYWLMEHWDIVAPSEEAPLVLILEWADDNNNGAVDTEETVEVEVI